MREVQHLYTLNMISIKNQLNALATNNSLSIREKSNCFLSFSPQNILAMTPVPRMDVTEQLAFSPNLKMPVGPQEATTPSFLIGSTTVTLVASIAGWTENYYYSETVESFAPLAIQHKYNIVN